MKVGVIAIARPTFDVPFAEKHAEAAFHNLRSSDLEVVGSPGLAMDIATVESRLESILRQEAEAVIVLQATFADSSLAVAATNHDLPNVLWAFPEVRTGGKLRLNSFCGINLAAFTLSNLEREYRWVQADPADPSAAQDVIAAIGARHDHGAGAMPTPSSAFAKPLVVAATAVRDRLESAVIGRVGERPDGFEPCGYEASTLREILGVEVQEVALPELFRRSAEASEDDVKDVREKAEAFLGGIDEVDQESLDRSLRMNVGLRSLIEENGWSGVATRCWPETFSEYGGAACTPMAMLTDDHTPGSCEADVYGNITGLVLSWLTDAPSFVADLVDLDPYTDSGVMWHCGLAPFALADPNSVPSATVHPNRKKPLLSEFPLKPGRVTVARFSQSRNMQRLVIGGGEMLPEPLAFSGTAGVIRFDSSVNDVLHTIMWEGLEHHYGIVYGDVRDELRALASVLEIPVIDL
ncbi:MAG: L-fucose/L-arabinose isomerase family protein [Acidimicrobiia bacterium]